MQVYIQIQKWALWILNEPKSDGPFPVALVLLPMGIKWQEVKCNVVIYRCENTTRALYGYSVGFWHIFSLTSKHECKRARGFFWRRKRSIRFIDCMRLSFFKLLQPQMQDIPRVSGCVFLRIFPIVVDLAELLWFLIHAHLEYSEVAEV